MKLEFRKVASLLVGAGISIIATPVSANESPLDSPINLQRDTASFERRVNIYDNDAVPAGCKRIIFGKSKSVPVLTFDKKSMGMVTLRSSRIVCPYKFEP